VERVRTVAVASTTALAAAIKRRRPGMRTPWE
jgi:hypothetical protein